MLKQKPLMIVSLLFTMILFTNCCTTKSELKENNTIIKKQSVPIPLAPGTAQISGKIIEIFEKDNISYCKIKVNEIKEYGPSTKLIGVGSEIELEIKNDFKESLKDSQLNNNEVNLTIVSLQGGMGQELKSYWKIINLNK
jgi:hypothetical protein